MNVLVWLGILFCISQSAMFSGLNLAFFSLSRLRLEIEAGKDNQSAIRILAMREDANFLLTTILWGNVGVNVLLALLSDSVMAGVTAFLFSTVLITFAGEIIPQAYFSRNALRMASAFTPAIRAYQWVLYPVAKPSAVFLNKWLGPEAIHFFEEQDLEELLRLHVDSPATEISALEGTGAQNFLKLDDIPANMEGELIMSESILELKFQGMRPLFPDLDAGSDNGFLEEVNASGKKWVIITDPEGTPRLALDSDGFLRDAIFAPDTFNPYSHCHRPVVINDYTKSLGDILPLLQVEQEHREDDVIDNDVILFWGDEKKIITGADILGRLLRGAID